MASLRFDIQVSIPESASGIRILDTDGIGGIVLPQIVVDKLKIVRSTIRDFKKYATKINEGLPNEEQTVRAIYRICHHDEGDGHRPDGPEMEI